MDLLAGLRSARATNPEQQPHQLQQQQQQQLQMLLQQQQMQFYAQNQTQMHQAPSQAQLIALQQSQLELQLQQMQMANLALQEQILLQHQQQQAAQAAAQTGSSNTTSGGYRSLQHQASRDNLDDSQQARRSALRNLPAARKQRDVSSSSASNLDWQAERMRFASPPPADKPPLSSSPPKLPELSSGNGANGPRQTSNDGAVRQSGPASNAPANIVTQHHRKTSSLASAASAQSAALSDAGSLYSPNQGPALILSKPKDEFAEDEEDDAIPEDTPGSPSLHASIRAMNLVGEPGRKAPEDAIGGDPREETETAKPKKVKRHTVILTSSLPRIVSPPPIDSKKAAAAKDSQSSSADSCSSSQSSSPTSDKSDIASFDSAGSVSTTSTSLPALSPTATTFVKMETALPSAENVKTRNFTVPAKASHTPILNPAAAAFSPAGSAAKTAINSRYPSSLSLQPSATTTPVATPPPMRLFSAPPPSTGTSSGFGTPTASNGITVIRQPRGPAKEAELSSKNFAGMIRRKAVGALRVAASNGGRISPVASPVVATFGQSAFDSHMRHATSPPLSSSIVSPPLGSGTFADFGAELTQRALKRRSQQSAFSNGNPGLGML